MEDLQGVDPSNLKWVELEKKPYLWAVVHESLRMMPGVSHRSARIAREEELVYKSKDGKTEHVIPRGTPIGMTSMINHWNTEFFPDPDEFIPERWLGDPRYANDRRDILYPFSTGSRNCIGKK